MSTVFQLDTAALTALFPEGSKARLNLQSAVVANLAQKLAIKQVDRLSDKVKAEVKDAVTRALLEQGITSPWVGQIQVCGNTMAAIRTAAKSAVDRELRDAIEEKVKERQPDIDKRIDVALERLVDPKQQDAMKAMLREILKGI